MQALAFFRPLCYTENMKYDYKALYEKSAAFYNKSPQRVKVLKLCNVGLTWLFVGAYALLWALAVFTDKLPSHDVVRLFCVPMAALLLVSVIRLGAERPRPYSEKGAKITPFVDRGDRDGDSFPSRHIACAAAITALFFTITPALGVLLSVCCLALAYVRFAIGVHYPSDLLAGIAVGSLCSIFLFL